MLSKTKRVPTFLAAVSLPLLLVGCSAPNPKLTPPAPSDTATVLASPAPSSSIAPAPSTRPLPAQPDAANNPLVGDLLVVYARFLDALNAFYRGDDAPLQSITTQGQFAHQLELRKSWNGDFAQQELLVPRVHVILLKLDDATIADTSVYRTVWYKSNGFQTYPVTTVRQLEHFHRDQQSGSWLFVEGFAAAPDVDLPDRLIPDGSK